MTEIVWGSTRKPVTSQRLATHIEREFRDEGFLYVGYPVLSAAEGVNSIDALWISPAHGVVIFHLIEGKDYEGFEEVQDEFANNLETKFRPHKQLMKGRTLLALPVVVTYAPMAKSPPTSDEYRIVTDDDLIETLSAINWENPELYAATHSVIQSISSIRKGKRRRIASVPNSLGSQLKRLEDSIANLDSIQSRAVIETVEGVQRIRGLAGSGKTIILALKAAYLHAQHPDWKIAVTFNTRSLKAQFHRLIETFVVEQTGEAPVWENIQIINAWGAPGGPSRTGVYFQFCVANGLEFYDFQQAKDRFSQPRAFEGAVQTSLQKLTDIKTIFDVILVDEAQDFHPNFLRLCYLALGPSKRLVYAYDELQSLTESSLPPPEELFGKKADGSPEVVFSEPQPGQPNQDIILEKCYRNSRPVLATAHALGFGIYRDVDPKTNTGLIQMFDRADLWKDVGYVVKTGSLTDGAQVTLTRTPQSSPEFLEEPGHSAPLVEFLSFAGAEQQAKWIADQVEKNVRHDELNFDDIIVINPDPLTTVREVGPARKLLFERGIQSHVAGVDTSSDIFFKGDDESIAFTGIFRAKGNEAGIVYVMNAQDCYQSFGSLGRVRNQLFTAITRSKAWVRVLGFGPNMDKLTEEFQRVAGHNYELNFVYPDEETRKHLKVINRDLTPEEQKSIKGAATRLSSLVSDISAGKVLIEDLPKQDVDALRKFLATGAGNANG
ncbi:MULTISPECIES: DEAD/DEAH box helicase [Agrobacterium]|uniref:ATP-binding domain-containing protein n=1 Tax=Agrobacterium rosae TaxID=1972867 RepID=A0AAW9FNR4_9HYPH|nr:MULTISPECIES: ATP-binding domain-containing protein [Agrobacterium]MDX8305084.1 ATP-binding domain-containing protein [Agrobacterium rosae]MDX8321365.1 ATP-binding domain-containing protein [Agrobacterium sp. rho-8.1]MDX8327175.1 ATP-binding domain-containing protein [Agrobacterium tumefaciens]